MTLKIDDDLITSPDTQHVAVRITKTAWLVTWLRHDHRLNRNQAITAMMIASTVAATRRQIVTIAGPLDRKDPIFTHVNSWAGELGLDGTSAALWVAEARKWQPAEFGISESPAEAGQLTSLTDEEGH